MKDERPHSRALPFVSAPHSSVNPAWHPRSSSKTCNIGVADATHDAPLYLTLAGMDGEDRAPAVANETLRRRSKHREIDRVPPANAENDQADLPLANDAKHLVRRSSISDHELRGATRAHFVREQRVHAGDCILFGRR